MEREKGILPATQDGSDDVPPSDEVNDGVAIDLPCSASTTT